MSDELGKRMKEYYEIRSRTYLTRRTPVAIRIDGKAFHTFTKGFWKPFDDILMKSMQETMLYLCKNIQGCVFGYTQSDEITLILIDYQNINSDAWFGYQVQKMCSVAASMATMRFNKVFLEFVYGYAEYNVNATMEQYNIYTDAMDKGAVFDARCFNIPREEVANLIYWRQLDATRNSIQMVGQAYFSHNQLQGKSGNAIQDMLFTKYGINWNNYPTSCKRGTACIKLPDDWRYGVRWKIDYEMPIIKGKDRAYVNNAILFEEVLKEDG